MSTDFGTLLAQTGWSGPSVVLFRRTSGNRLFEFELLSTVLLSKQVRDALARGSIVVIEPKKVRIKSLPIGGDDQ